MYITIVGYIRFRILRTLRSMFSSVFMFVIRYIIIRYKLNNIFKCRFQAFETFCFNIILSRIKTRKLENPVPTIFIVVISIKIN